MSGRAVTPRDPRYTDGMGGSGPSRYDLVLAVVPLAFLAALLLTALADVPLRVGLVGAGIVGALALVDGLFLNPPRRPRTGGDRR